MFIYVKVTKIDMLAKLSDVIHLVIPCKVDINQSNLVHVKEVQRSKKCVVLVLKSLYTMYRSSEKATI